GAVLILKAKGCPVKNRFSRSQEKMKVGEAKRRQKLFHVAVCQLNVLLPVIPGNVMLAGAEVVMYNFSYGTVWSRHGNRCQSLEAIEAIDRAGILGGQEFTFGVCPQVFRGAGHI